jgi:hypothetical protein
MELPEDIAQELETKWTDLPRTALESLALEAYRSHVLSAAQLSRLLGFETRMQVDAFLKEHEVYNFTAADFEQDRETLRQLRAIEAQEWACSRHGCRSQRPCQVNYSADRQIMRAPRVRSSLRREGDLVDRSCSDGNRLVVGFCRPPNATPFPIPQRRPVRECMKSSVSAFAASPPRQQS